MKQPVVAIVLLWAIALAATFLVVHETSVLTLLGPLFAICMIGSVVVVRRAVAMSRAV